MGRTFTDQSRGNPSHPSNPCSVLSSAPREHMRRQVNLKFTLALLVSIAVLGTAVYFVHGFQVEREAGAFRDRARQAEEEKNFGQAIEYLERYLGFRPEDTDSLAKLGELLDEKGK